MRPAATQSRAGALIARFGQLAEAGAPRMPTYNQFLRHHGQPLDDESASPLHRAKNFAEALMKAMGFKAEAGSSVPYDLDSEWVHPVTGVRVELHGWGNLESGEPGLTTTTTVPGKQPVRRHFLSLSYQYDGSTKQLFDALHYFATVAA